MYHRFYFNINHIKILHNLVNKRSFSIYNSEIQSKLKSGKLTYYDVLSVPKNADKITIREAYLKLVKQYHPDTSKDKNSRLIFICIKESHDVLIDSNKRRLYDQKLSQYKLKDDQSIKLHRASSKDIFDSERWERYKRYTSGERNDIEDNNNTPIVTIAAIFLSCVTVTLISLIFGELFVKLSDYSILDDIYEDNDVKHEQMVRAFFNPISLKWERIIKPFEAPSVAVLKKYYKLDNEPGMPKNITTIEMPWSQTNKPTILYDPRRNKPIIILQN